ncbi:MAG: response regulator [Lachnospiraceae bacterium]
MYTVVVADDEEALRKALIRRVDWEAAGFQVVGEAEHGIEALELVERLEPDLLLTDVKMPFMSGIELARAVREIRPTMHIAFLSGYDDFSYAQQAIQYNIISYMLKPISSSELMLELAKIKKLIDEKFETFTRAQQVSVGMETWEFFLPLLLDTYKNDGSAERNAMLVEKAVSYGFLDGESETQRYAVIVTSFWDEFGNNKTIKENMNAIDTILKKYIKYSNIYIEGRIVSILVSTNSGFDKYLHILVEEIIQSAKRVMNYTTSVGVSRVVEHIVNVQGAYASAMQALEYHKDQESKAYFISDIELVIENSKKSAPSICDMALELIETSYTDTDLSLVSMSKKIAVSPNYLSGLIKKTTGSTFIDLLVKKRIQTAQKMLLTTEYKIKDIAELCGYSDQHYFSYCFKKYAGCSPNAFRQQHEEVPT